MKIRFPFKSLLDEFISQTPIWGYYPQVNLDLVQNATRLMLNYVPEACIIGKTQFFMGGVRQTSTYCPSIARQELLIGECRIIIEAWE